MKKSVISVILLSSLFGASAAQANTSGMLTTQVVSALKSVTSSSQFHTKAKDTFVSSEGQEVKVHLARDAEDSRVLIMDTKWSLLPMFIKADEGKITTAANEYIEKHNLDVMLSNPVHLHMNGSYGYAFDVAQTGDSLVVSNEASESVDYSQKAELLDCSIDQSLIENRIKCNQRYGGS